MFGKSLQTEAIFDSKSIKSVWQPSSARPLAGFKGPLRGRENWDEISVNGQKGEKGGFIPLPPTPGSATT